VMGLDQQGLKLGSPPALPPTASAPSVFPC
jgi:hypothetical protein